jgi:hypothetical protein
MLGFDPAGSNNGPAATLAGLRCGFRFMPARRASRIETLAHGKKFG